VYCCVFALHFTLFSASLLTQLLVDVSQAIMTHALPCCSYNAPSGSFSHDAQAPPRQFTDCIMGMATLVEMCHTAPCASLSHDGTNTTAPGGRPSSARCSGTPSVPCVLQLTAPVCSACAAPPAEPFCATTAPWSPCVVALADTPCAAAVTGTACVSALSVSCLSSHDEGWKGLAQVMWSRPACRNERACRARCDLVNHQ